MKIYVNILVLAVAVMFSSCKDWLDVTPEGQATEGEMFSSGNGYRSVLNGLYKAMGDPQLYGMELTYGMIDCMPKYMIWRPTEPFQMKSIKMLKNLIIEVPVCPERLKGCGLRLIIL